MYRTGSILTLVTLIALMSGMLSAPATAQILDAESSGRSRAVASSHGILVTPSVQQTQQPVRAEETLAPRRFQSQPMQSLPWRNQQGEQRQVPNPNAAEALNVTAESIYESTPPEEAASQAPQSATAVIQQVDSTYYEPQTNSPQAPANSLDFELPERQMSSPQPWPRKNIRDISINMTESAENLPMDRSGSMVTQADEDFTTFAPTQKVFGWVAPNIRYQPLYFEDVALERYGQEHDFGKQAVLSALRMTKSTFFLPWNMYVENPFSCDYPYGFCRPGNCVPETRQQHYYERCYDR